MHAGVPTLPLPASSGSALAAGTDVVRLLG